MQTSLASILLAAGLEGLSVKDAEPSQDFPGTAALEHSVSAAWNELFGLFADIVGALVLLGLSLSFRERALRGELFAIRFVTPIADRVFRLER